MKLGAFNLDEPLPELKEPHALAMLRPWVDVGRVGDQVLAWLETHFNAKNLGKLDRPGDFFDFTRYRPTIYTAQGQRQVDIPNSYVYYGRQDSGNDLIFLHLLEPHSHGEDYVDSVVQLLEKFDTRRYCLLGSMYDYMPHTRPLLVSGAAVGERPKQELDKLGIKGGSYQGPTSITSLISQRASSSGIETMSLLVHLPQYTQLEEDYMGTVRIMEVVSSLYNLPMDESCIKKAEKQQAQISVALDKNPELKTIVEQLEIHYDARAERTKEEEMPRLSPEVERFLAEMDRRFREG